MGFLSKLFGKGGSKTKGPALPIVDISRRFELMGRTGQGSMSKVWRARDGKLGRVICLKILDKEKTAKFEARFPGLNRPMEGAICMALRHRNIVQTFEYGLTTDKEQYLVMELITGQGLNFLIETASPKLKGRIIPYLIQMADGLEYIHQQKYLHRDICPRNIMVTEEDVIKIIDFGLTVPYTPAFCKPGNRTGTADYMAAEIVRRVTTDHRVDLFALGVTAFEMLTGQLPWEKGPSQQVLLSHMNSSARNIRDFRPDLDDQIVKVIMKSVERDPRDRYQTAAAFRDALQNLPKQDY